MSTSRTFKNTYEQTVHAHEATKLANILGAKGVMAYAENTKIRIGKPPLAKIYKYDDFISNLINWHK